MPPAIRCFDSSICDALKTATILHDGLGTRILCSIVHAWSVTKKGDNSDAGSTAALQD